ncbi:MAG: sigma-54-dependent Fis family transcriptional regulator [Deltaproteobacteria bacterium]|nr:sigma-54-dependent Fis family transcriptional regulator [Deltaproteobacteria bacterium]
MQETILIVDDEVAIRRALERLLTDDGYRLLTASNADEALQHVAREPIQCALVDLVLPGRSGIELVRLLRAQMPDSVSIVMTGFGTIASAVDAMKAGAFHYLTKPFELDDIRQLVQTALDHQHLRVENRELKRAVQTRYQFANIIGHSDAMHGVFRLIEKVAATDSTVLLLGESGTGKELVARAVHCHSHRAQHPLVTVNCAAIPDDLLESELFGHVKGAFTSASSTQVGKFVAAHGGTIFLDEIADMSPKLQVKLLRVIQERRVEPLGSTQSQEIDVRIIAATNHDLELAIQERRFREDLYYRLNVIPVKLPPLRDRRDDIAFLAQHFLARFNADNGRQVEGFAPEVIVYLTQYEWPGNVRELENLIERLVVIKGHGIIVPEDLPAHMLEGSVSFQSPALHIPDTGICFKAAVTEFENALILQALAKTGGNKNRAAGLLQLNRTTLVEKIKKKQLERHVAE